MAKKVLLLTISLLISIILADIFPQVVVAAPVPQVVTENQAARNVQLTGEDLPPGFRQLPPTVAAQLANKLLEVFRQQLPQADLKSENFWAFVNPQNFQFIMGVTGNFPKQSDSASFDAGLQQLQKPAQQKQTFSQLRENLKSFQGIEVTNYTAFSPVNKVANASTDVILDLTIQGQPMQMDITVFRRDSVAALTAVMYMKGAQNSVSVGDVASKLDKRITQPTPAANVSGTSGTSGTSGEAK